MQVPIYQRQAEQQGLPKDRQTTQVDASNFLGGTTAAALNYGEQAAGDINKAVQHHYEQQLQEANATRTQSAINDINKHDQHAYNNTSLGADGKPVSGGWANVLGQDVFKQTNGKLLQDNVMEARSQKISEIAASLGNDQQRNDFMAYADRSGLQVQGRIEGHMAQEYRRFQQTTAQDTIDTESNSMMNAYNDHAALQEHGARIDQAAIQLSAINGLGEEHGKVLAQQARSKAYRGAINASIQNGDVQNAHAIIERFGDTMDPADRDNAKSNTFDAAAALGIQSNPQVMADATRVKPSLPIDEQLKQQLTPEAIDRSYKILLHSESPTGQFLNGKPVTSPKGAVGAAQVMEATGPEAATLAGLPWNRDKWLHDEAYNTAIGKAYFKKQLHDNNGDLGKAYAAYNAGPGALKAAIEQPGDDWLAQLPSETQKYVANNMAAYNAGKDKTGTWLDYGSPEQKLRVNRAAESMLERSRNVEATKLENAASNQYTQTYNTGQSGDLIPKESFVSAFGQAEGEAKHKNYLDNQAHAATAFSLKDMPLAKLNETVAAAMPKEGDDTTNATREWKQYEELHSIASHIQNERNKDPVVAAAGLGFPVKPVNLNKPVEAAQEIAGRVTISDRMSEQYGTPPAILMNEEAKNWNDTFGAMSVKDQLTFMSTLKKHSDPLAYNMTMQQLRKDSPVTALAGSLYGIDSNYFSGNNAYLPVNGQKAAETILKGERMLNPTKDDQSKNGQNKNLYMPEDKELQSAFDAATNGAFAGKEQTAKNTFAAYRAAYAGLSTGLGDTAKVFVPTRSDEALQMVTGTKGGALELYGNKIIPPYGMPEDIFKDRIEAQFKEQMNRNTKEGFYHNIEHYKIIPLDDGVYGFTDGNDIKPIVVNLNNKTAPLVEAKKHDPIVEAINP